MLIFRARHAQCWFRLSPEMSLVVPYRWGWGWLGPARLAFLPGGRQRPVYFYRVYFVWGRCQAALPAGSGHHPRLLLLPQSPAPPLHPQTWGQVTGHLPPVIRYMSTRLSAYKGGTIFYHFFTSSELTFCKLKPTCLTYACKKPKFKCSAITKLQTCSTLRSYCYFTETGDG